MKYSKECLNTQEFNDIINHPDICRRGSINISHLLKSTGLTLVQKGRSDLRKISINQECDLSGLWDYKIYFSI